jgi:hypothetical protein
MLHVLKSIDSKLGSSPMSSFGIIPVKNKCVKNRMEPDIVFGTIPKPVRERSVLLVGLDQTFFDSQRFVCTLSVIVNERSTI